MPSVKSQTKDCTPACKAGYWDKEEGVTRSYANEKDSAYNQDAYALGKWLGSHKSGQPHECTVHTLVGGVRHYVVKSDTYENGAVFAIYHNDTANPNIGIIFRNALEAGYR